MEAIQLLQQPIHAGFTAASTTAEVIAGIDLSNKTAIVTGGYAYSPYNGANVRLASACAAYLKQNKA